MIRPLANPKGGRLLESLTISMEQEKLIVCIFYLINYSLRGNIVLFTILSTKMKT